MASIDLEEQEVEIMDKFIDCVYENGVLKPLNKIPLKEGQKIRMLIREDRMKGLDKYVGMIKLKKPLKLEEILDLEEDTWLY